MLHFYLASIPVMILYLFSVNEQHMVLSAVCHTSVLLEIVLCILNSLFDMVYVIILINCVEFDFTQTCFNRWVGA